MDDDLSDSSASVELSKTVCLLCRQRKTRCDRRLPSCGLCVKAKLDCEYAAAPKKRGLRAGYVAQLESRINVLEHRMQEVIHKQSTPMLERVLPSSANLHEDATPDDDATPATNSSGLWIVSSVGGALHVQPNDGDTPALPDLKTFPKQYFCGLADAWLRSSRNWLPIVDASELQSSLDELPLVVDHIENIVLRAIIALEMAYSSTAICLGYEGRHRLSQRLRSQVIVRAMSEPCLNSIRALYIIAFLDYGSDNIHSCFNLMAMCRQMADSLGLFQKLLNNVEHLTPNQVGPPAQNLARENSGALSLTWCTVAWDAVSSLGVPWRGATGALLDHFAGIALLSSPDFADSLKTHIHLNAIGLQPVHAFFYACGQGEHATLEGETVLLMDQLHANLVSYVDGLPSSGYHVLDNGTVEFDVNTIFTRLLANATIIMIYQRFMLETSDEAQIARERCTAAYDRIVDVARNTTDFDTEVSSPGFAQYLAVAARYYIVMQRHTRRRREGLSDVITHAIKMCARRWPLARRLEYVYRAAVCAVDGGPHSGLPDEYWDLKKSQLDISESMKRWAIKHISSSGIATVNGAYD